MFRLSINWLFVSQTLSLRATNRQKRTLSIGDISGVVPKIKFAQIAMEMVLADVMIGANDSALEQAEKTFDGIPADYNIALSSSV